MPHPDFEERGIVLRRSRYKTADAVFDARESLVECKAVICGELISQNCPEAVDIQLCLLPRTEQLGAHTQTHVSGTMLNMSSMQVDGGKGREGGRGDEGAEKRESTQHS